MANNRMWLTNDRLGVKVYLGKYYPGTGWYTDNSTIAAELDAGFDKDSIRSPFGPLDWRIEYETGLDEIEQLEKELVIQGDAA